MTDSIPSHVPTPASVWHRRRWLGSALAGAAVLGGTGLAWWRANHPDKRSETINPDFWMLDFPTPDGTSLRMRTLRGKPLLLNFWATWCPPCVEELPLLSRFHEANSAKGWQVLGLAIDKSDPVQRFLEQTPVTFPIALAGLPGIEISRSLGNLAGGLPFSVVLGSDDSVRHRKIGQITPDELGIWAVLK